ncbi:hypothetical protein [Actinoplanes philippinensis]|uniref:hypothetical protein n=1 Tax=Actinoplanes philippinensis TaxID=35752 RepID=UPI0033F498A9
MVISAASIAVLAVMVAVVIKQPADNQLVTPHMVTTQSPGPHGMYVEVTVPEPIDRDERLALTGDNGTRAEVGAKLDLEQPSLDNPGERLVFFKVHVHNTGTTPVLARLTSDAWVLDSAGESYRGDYMRSDMVDMTADPPQLEPGWEVDLTAGFPVPKDAKLTRLHIALPLGGSTPSVEWNLS